MKKSKEVEVKIEQRVEEKKEIIKPKSPSKSAAQPAKQTLDEDEILKIRGNLKKWVNYPCL